MLRGCTVIVVIVAILLRYFGSALYKLGAFSSISLEQEHGNENCEILSNEIEDLNACEDIGQFVDGTVILSCSKRDALFKNALSGKPLSQIIRENSRISSGNLFLMNNINIPTKHIVKIKLIGRECPDFNSLGIGVITDSKNIKWIYVVNHRRDGDVVEIFRFNKDKKTATFVDEVHSPLFIFLNDVKPLIVNRETDKMGFYVLNSFGFPLFSKLNIVMETLLSLIYGFSDLVYCEQDNKYKNKQYKEQWKCDVVDKNLKFGNGVEISNDNKIVYSVETVAMNINVYKRNIDGTLDKIKKINTPSMCDNIIVDHKTNDLYIGCHPNPLQFMQHARNHSVVSGSKILRWNPNNKGINNEEMFELYLSNGHTKNHVSGSSVGLYDIDTKTLLIGTPNVGVMRCKL